MFHQTVFDSARFLIFLIAAILLAVLWMSREIERTRRIRELNSPAPQPGSENAEPARKLGQETANPLPTGHSEKRRGMSVFPRHANDTFLMENHSAKPTRGLESTAIPRTELERHESSQQAEHTPPPGGTNLPARPPSPPPPPPPPPGAPMHAARTMTTALVTMARMHPLPSFSSECNGRLDPR